MGGKVLEYEAKTIKKEGIREGIQEGIKEGIRDVAMEMFINGLDYEYVKKIVKGALTDRELGEIQKESEKRQ